MWIKKQQKQVVEEVSYDFEDPLGATLNNDDIDDIDREILQDTKNRSHSLDNTLENKKTDRCGFDIELPDFQPWREKRANMNLISKPKDFSANNIEILKLRIKNIEECGFPTRKSDAPPEDLSRSIPNHKEALLSSWTKGDRVEAFRIVTEVAQLPAKLNPDDDDYLHFWLQIIDIFDIFGNLVFDRLLAKSNEERLKMKQTEISAKSFTADQIPQNVKDMTKHWFMKVSEVVDVLDRIYVETSLIACLRFLDSDNLRLNLERLAAMCSRLSNDTPSLYARVYISRIAMHIDAADRSAHWRLLHDFMQTKNDVMALGISPTMSETSLRRRRVNQLAISWIVQCVSYGAHSVDDLAPMWHYCDRVPVSEKTYLLITSCIEGLPSKYLAMHAQKIVEMIFSLKYSYEEPLIQLGKRFATSLLEEDDRKIIKKTVFQRIGDIADLNTYVRCCTEWSKFVAKNFEITEVEKVVEIVVPRLQIDEKVRNGENSQVLIELVMAFLTDSISRDDYMTIIHNPYFRLMVDIVGDESSTASKCAKRLLECLVKKFKPGSISETETCYFIIEQATILCKYLSYEITDEVKINEELVAEALSLFDLRSNENKMAVVELLVKARGALGLRQYVLEKIVDMFVDLTTHGYTTMKRGAKKSEFLRIGITNISITSPAIHDHVKKFRISLKIVQLCVMANFSPQLDATCKRCLEILETMGDQKIELAQIPQLVLQYLATLIMVPDPIKKKKPLYYYHKLVEIVEKEEKLIGKADIWMGCLRYLCAMRGLGQIDGMRRGNEVLYAGNREILDQIDENIDDMMARLLTMANEPLVAVLILENVVQLFEIHEEIRSTLRGLLKRAYGSKKTEKRLTETIRDLKNINGIEEILNKLGIL